MHVMVVDDEVDAQWLFKQRFRKEIRENNFQFVFAESAEEALACLSSESELDIVLILSDIRMPGMGGLELLRILKEKSPDLKVVMITAFGDDENYQTAMNYGADGFVTKPIDFKELKTLMRTVAENQT